MRSWDDRIEKREKIGAGSPFVYFLPPEREPRGLIVER